jgi:hypothetical protein
MLAASIWQQGIVILTGTDVDIKGGHHDGSQAKEDCWKKQITNVLWRSSERLSPCISCELLCFEGSRLWRTAIRAQPNN